jgi:hypothetical protein
LEGFSAAVAAFTALVEGGGGDDRGGSLIRSLVAAGRCPGGSAGGTAVGLPAAMTGWQELDLSVFSLGSAGLDFFFSGFFSATGCLYGSMLVLEA